MNAANELVASDATPDSGGACPHCGRGVDWSAVSWCPSCGFYPAVGGLIETPDVESEVEVYDYWWQAVPRWTWILAGGMFALFFVSIAVRVVCAESPVRLWWTLGQMAVGFIAFCVAHLMAYLHGAAQTDRVGPLDAIVKPMATWHPVLFSLPQTCRIVCTGAWSLTAIVLAFFIIDGIDFDAMGQAQQQAAVGPRKKRTSPMAYVIRSAHSMAKAQGRAPASHSEAQSLEDALAEFTGESGIRRGDMGLLSDTGRDGDNRTPGHLDDVAGANGIDVDAYIEQQQQLILAATTCGRTEGQQCGEQTLAGQSKGTASASSRNDQGSRAVARSRTRRNGPSRSEPIVRNESIECVVFGYTTNVQGDPRSLLLAAPDGKQLRFVAKVSFDDVDPDVGQEMTEHFYSLRQRWPVVSSPYGGRWLKPELFCQVEFSGWTIGGRLSDPYVTRLAVLTTPVHVDSDVTSVRH